MAGKTSEVVIRGEASAIGNFIAAVLGKMYGEDRPGFDRKAKEAGVPLESMVAAAVTQGLIETFGLPVTDPE
jgi:hypothetical protein